VKQSAESKDHQKLVDRDTAAIADLEADMRKIAPREDPIYMAYRLYQMGWRKVKV